MQSTFMHMCCQARQLDSYSTARNSSTARQLDRTRQNSTPRHMESASTGSTKLDRNSTGSTGSTGKASTAPVDSASTQCLDGASEPRQLWTAHGSTARAQRAPRHACPHQCTRRCTQNVFARSSTVCTHLDINYIRGKIRPERTIRAPRPPSARVAAESAQSRARALDPRRLHRPPGYPP